MYTLSLQMAHEITSCSTPTNVHCMHSLYCTQELIVVTHLSQVQLHTIMPQELKKALTKTAKQREDQLAYSVSSCPSFL